MKRKRGQQEAVVVLTDSDENDEELASKLLYAPLFSGKGRQIDPLLVPNGKQKPPEANNGEDGSKRMQLALIASHEDAKPSSAFPFMSRPQNAFQIGHTSTAKLTISPALGDQLWSQKHAPGTEAELVINKKKIAELSEFLRSHVDPLNSRSTPSLMILSGSAGSGKSTALRVVASQLDFEITEWQPPVPTLWTEHGLQGMQGQQYMSKLDAFESFVSHAKLAPLRMQPVNDMAGEGLPKRRKLILVDDLPHASGAEQIRRLTQSLGCKYFAESLDLHVETLAETTRNPVIVLLTCSLSSAESLGTGERYSQALSLRGVINRLSVAGAVNLSFGSVSLTAVVKTLNRIAEAEGVTLEADQAKSIAISSNGDLLNAIETLQLYSCGKVDPAMLTAKRGKKGRQRAQRKKDKGRETAARRVEMTCLQRDSNLTAFHALGKLLYNKRQSDNTAEGMTDTEKDRGEMIEVPEDVVMASGMEVTSILAFLHENFLHFIDDGAVEDALAVADYFSQADLLLGCNSWMAKAEASLENLAAGSSIGEACSGAIAARGLMWGNAHPAPKRWLPLKGPQYSNVNNALQLNLSQLQDLGNSDALPGRSAQELATTYLPFLRIMSGFTMAAHVARCLPRKWTRVWQGQLATEEMRQPGQFESNALQQEAWEDRIDEDDD